MTATQIKTLAAVSTLGEFMVDFRGSFAHSANGSAVVNTRALMALVASGAVVCRNGGFYSVAK